MTSDINYGKLTKRIVFTENDHRHAQLIVKLKHDGLKQSEFFRSLITAYLSGDERILSYIEEISKLSKSRKTKSKALSEKGKQNISDFGFTDGEIENIFDLIEEEYPEL
tara:strand:+ start:778 stop:1104 length:327 start_codon:yes stop_codon:yes gene_type:complete